MRRSVPTPLLSLSLILLLAPAACGDDDGGGNNQNNNNDVGNVCGDGVLGGSEACDDGANNSDTAPDGCRSDCREAYCGDGVVDTGEACDDSNNTSGDGCTADCLSDETCGNGVVDDHVGEECDDGGTTGGDGCSETCQEEACGNGTEDTGEGCDDGNLASHDGCSSGCTTETYDWQERDHIVSPAAYRDAAMVYDRARDVIVLYGGDGQVTTSLDYSDQTWEYDGTTWTRRMGVGVPGQGRRGHHMAYDEARGVVVLFGGEGGLAGVAQNDTWEYDGTTWTDVTSSLSGSPPSARSHGAMAYDPVGQVVILFGGDRGAVQGLVNDTWEYDGTAWTPLTPSASPSARGGAGFAYDRTRQVIVLFGGQTGTSSHSDETWEYSAGAWQNVTLTTRPDSRAGHVLVYDPWLQRTVLFGGSCGDSITCYLSDTWSWDGTSWSLLATNLAPNGRAGCAAAPLLVSRGILLHGGVTRASGATLDYYDETWLLRYDVPTTPYPDEVCDNSADDDGDALVDCADPDCEGLPCASGRCTGGACQ